MATPGEIRTSANHQQTSAASSSISATRPRPKKGAKTEIKETLLAPRFYTTNFDEMEMLFNKEINKNLNQAAFLLGASSACSLYWMFQYMEELQLSNSSGPMENNKISYLLPQRNTNFVFFNGMQRHQSL